MEPSNSWASDTQRNNEMNEQVERKKPGIAGQFRKANILMPGSHAPNIQEQEEEKHPKEADTAKLPQIRQAKNTGVLNSQQSASRDTAIKNESVERSTFQTVPHVTRNLFNIPYPSQQQEPYFSANSQEENFLGAQETQKLPLLTRPLNTPGLERPGQQSTSTHFPYSISNINRSKALLLIALLCIILLPVLNISTPQLNGPRGLASVFMTENTNNQNLFKNLKAVQQNKGKNATQALTPQQIIDQVMKNMTIEQKLGQMMLVQFTGGDYATSLELGAMVTQQNVGAIILSGGNNNIVSKDQLKTLIQQIQQNAAIPLIVSTDQEGGQVDRLAALDGARPSAASIGLSNNPDNAKALGIQDASDLSSYGFNLNLAPVVDVDTLNSSIIHTQERAFGRDVDTVTKMAGSYLQGLQQGGKVFGTLKHFPGLGDVYGDPHQVITRLSRTKNAMEQIDWAPYRSLIQQDQVHAIMVTHDILPAIDNTMPASLSTKVVQAILRDEMGFQGVIVTDSLLNMVGISDYATPGQAAALAVEAGSDLLMGAGSFNDVATMVNGIKDAMASGAITQQRIDDSVRRILMMKYQMGILPLPK